MLTLDQRANFAKGILLQGYDNMATIISLIPGGGADFPTVTTGYNLTWWNNTDYADPADDPEVEIVRVTGLSGDVFTVLRAQEGTAATNKNIPNKTYKLVLSLTAKMIEDIATQAGTGTVQTGSNEGIGHGILDTGASTSSNLVFKSLIAGANVTITDNGTALTITATGGGGGGSFYQTVQRNLIPLPQEIALNFTTLFTATDNSGNGSTDIDIDIANLTANSTFITDVVSIINNTTNNPSSGKAYVNGSDTTLGFLASKLVAGTNITLNVLNPGANEQIQIVSASGSGSNTIGVIAGNTLTGATLPQPISMGDGNSYDFFDFGTGAPLGVVTVGNVAQQKITAVFQVDGSNVVLIDALSVWVDIVHGTPVDHMRLSIQTVSSGNPTGTILGSVSFDPINTPSRQGASLSSTLELTAGFYAFVIDRTGSNDNTNCWGIGYENAGGSNSAPFLYDGTNWNTSNHQPEIFLTKTYVKNDAYISAQGTGHRMESVIVNSGGGQTYKDVIPTVLQICEGFCALNASIGGSTTAIVSGTVPGFGSIPLVPINKYIVQSSDGTIASGSSGTIVGRSVRTDTMVIIPA